MSNTRRQRRQAKARQSPANSASAQDVGRGRPSSGHDVAFDSLTTDLLAVVGTDGRFKRLAPRFPPTFGYVEADLLGQTFLSFLHPDDRPVTSAALDKLSNRQPTLGVKNRFRCKDESYRRLAWTALNTPEGLLYAVARDITEVEQPAADRGRSMARGAAAGLAQKERVLTSVCHDVQQPLTVILVQTQLLQRQLARGEPISAERLERHLEHVYDAARRLRDMSEDLLDSSLQQSGPDVGLLLAPTNVVALVRQAVGEHQLVSDRHQFLFDAEVPRLEASLDQTRVYRVLTNLLTNAMKYSPGGGAIEVSVRLGEGPSGKLARLSVRDQGLGIPTDDLPHIFEPFHRGKNVIGRFSGRGLGLASARELVELHGGTISAESEEGRGSTFSVCLPLCPPVGAGRSGT